MIWRWDLHSEPTVDDEVTLFHCELPDCDGCWRAPVTKLNCFGRRDRRHSRTAMQPIDDTGEPNTEGLAVGGREPFSLTDRSTA